MIKKLCNVLRTFLNCSLILCLALTISSCATNTPKPSEGLAKNELTPRADPGYIQQLEKQSLLLESASLSRVVTGTELAWQAGGINNSAGTLLDFADTWLYIHPYSIITDSNKDVFSLFADSRIWPALRESGVNGIYIAPIFGSGELWAYNDPNKKITGEGPVQFKFSDQAGTEEQYRKLMQSTIDHNIIVGSDLIPAATGLGPDFLLATRFQKDYPGIYCIIEIPKEIWSNLPKVEEKETWKILNPETVKFLTEKKLLPNTAIDNFTVINNQGGWAVTNEIRGVDGNPRRWVYRYFKDPSFAVLNWEDPSQAAHRILSASAVKQVGLLGQSLIGLDFRAIKGLEQGSSNIYDPSLLLEPALTATKAMGREIHRYGGWVWFKDNSLSLPSLQEVSNTGVDIISDNVFSPAAEHALLTGNTSLLKFMTDELINLNIASSKLMHQMPNESGIDYSLNHLKIMAAKSDNPSRYQELLGKTQDELQKILNKQSLNILSEDILYTTSTGLVAMALNVKEPNISAKDIESIKKGHKLLFLFKSILPGSISISGQDLVGAMPVLNSSEAYFANRGSYALTESTSGLSITRHGIAKTSSLYPTAEVQAIDKNSFISKVGEIQKIRKETKVYSGKIIARPETTNNSIAILIKLPDDSYLLQLSNFSRGNAREEIILPLDLNNFSTTRVYDEYSKIKTTGQKFVVTLEPWQSKIFIFKSKINAKK